MKAEMFDVSYKKAMYLRESIAYPDRKLKAIESPHFLNVPAFNRFPLLENELKSRHDVQIPRDWTIANFLTASVAATAKLYSEYYRIPPVDLKDNKISLIVDDYFTRGINSKSTKKAKNERSQNIMVFFESNVRGIVLRGAIRIPNDIDGRINQRSGIPWFISEATSLAKNGGYFNKQYPYNRDRSVGFNENDFIQPRRRNLSVGGVLLASKIAEIIKTTQKR